MMGLLAQGVDQFLRGKGRFAGGGSPAAGLRWLLVYVAVFGVVYGGVMGSYSALSPGRAHQILYSALKLPMLLLVTFALCMPSFFVINTVVGLRADFGLALQAVVAMQSCITIVLASLAPVTAFFYLSIADYNVAVLFNGLMFAVASITAQFVVRRHYAPLIRRSPRHRAMLYVWFFLYVFVGIQMGWVLRPFIGAPHAPVAFFRSGAWGNAYVVVAGLIGDVLRGMLPS